MRYWDGSSMHLCHTNEIVCGCNPESYFMCESVFGRQMCRTTFALLEKEPLNAWRCTYWLTEEVHSFSWQTTKFSESIILSNSPILSRFQMDVSPVDSFPWQLLCMISARPGVPQPSLGQSSSLLQQMERFQVIGS